MFQNNKSLIISVLLSAVVVVSASVFSNDTFLQLLLIAGVFFLLLQKGVVHSFHSTTIAIGALIALVVLRPWMGVEQLFSPLSILIIGLMVYVLAVTHNAPLPVQHKPVMWGVADWGIVVLLISIALLHSTVYLGDKNFQNDEFYHVEAAQGLLQEGRFVQWDSVADAARVSPEGEDLLYPRALVYTAQVAASFAVFGENEVAARLPSVLWYVVLLVGAYVTSFFLFRDRVAASAIVLALIFLDHLSLHSRLSRMYTMLCAVGAVMMMSWYVIVTRWEQYDPKKRVASIAVAIAVSALAIATHPVALLFFPSFGLYMAYEAFIGSTNAAHARMLRGAIISLLIVGALIYVINAYTGVFINERFIGAGQSFNIVYEDLLLSVFGAPLVAGVLFVLLPWSSQWNRAWVRYQWFIALGATLILAYGVNRYNAIRYLLLFTIPFVVLISGVLYERIRMLVRRPVVAGLLTVVVLVPFSWPGIPQSAYTIEARADLTHRNGYGHDFETAYTYIREHMNKDDVVYAQEFRTWYWGKDPELEWIELGEDRATDAEQLRDWLQQQPEQTGAWFVWSEAKEKHVRKRIVGLIEEHSQVKHEIEEELYGTNMKVYYVQTLQPLIDAL